MHKGGALQSDDGSDVFSSGSQESLTAIETSMEWQATPQVQMKLHSLNNFLRQADGRVSPVRSQLNTNAEGVSSSTRRYYKRKGMQVVEASLDAIAPGQCKWLLQQVLDAYSHSTNSDVNLPEKTLLSRLVTLYNEATNWYTRQQILSVFVADYSKTVTELYSWFDQVENRRGQKTCFSIPAQAALLHLLFCSDAGLIQLRWITFLILFQAPPFSRT